MKSRPNNVLQVGHWNTVTRVAWPAFFSGFTGPWQQHDVFELPYSFANIIGLVKWRFNKARNFLLGAAAWPLEVGPKPPSPHRTQVLFRGKSPRSSVAVFLLDVALFDRLRISTCMRGFLRAICLTKAKEVLKRALAWRSYTSMQLVRLVYRLSMSMAGWIFEVTEF